MLARPEIERAVELQARGYQLLRWLEKALDQGFIVPEAAHAYATMAESAYAWIERHYTHLPSAARPDREDLLPFSKLFFAASPGDCRRTRFTGPVAKLRLDAARVSQEGIHNPTLTVLGLPTNKAGFKAFVGTFYTSFSETQFLPQKVLVEGDTAMFRWIFRGIHTGDFNGVKPTGKKVEINAFTAFKLGNDGKVIEQHDVADLVTLMRTIGAMP